MRIVFALLLALVPAAAQTPLVRILNTGRPATNTFQVGDRFEVLLTGAPNQPISVRTTKNGRTDWSPIIGATDSTGRWSTAGKFEKGDFGGWSEIWTVGGKLASPIVEFSVNAPCLPGGQGMVAVSGPNMMQTCDTAEGSQSFSTSSGPPSREQTQDTYQMGILQEIITGQQPYRGEFGLQTSRGGRGDETADLITNLIGVNALSGSEIRNVLTIVRIAFARPDNIAPGANYPARSLKLVRHLADFTDDSSVQRQIAETLEYLQAR